MLQKYRMLSLWLAALAVVSCEVDQHDHANLKSGRALYEHHCAPCHKADGSGTFLKGVPANRDTELSVLQIMHKVQSVSEEKRAMPTFKKMSQQEASMIAIYLNQLKKR